MVIVACPLQGWARQDPHTHARIAGIAISMAVNEEGFDNEGPFLGGQMFFTRADLINSRWGLIV